jgi:hypothetical protein
MWLNAPEKTDGYLGFVYIIENLVTGRYYIGKKQFTLRCRRMVAKKTKPGKRAKITHIDSDWKNYWGSCNDLLKDLKTYGQENFRRTILKLCVSKYELALAELKEQLNRNVLDDPKSYNQIINVRLRKAK